MTLVLEFGGNADFVDVPAEVIEEKARLQEAFFAWLYGKDSQHAYWDSERTAVVYRSEAFLEWLSREKGAETNTAKLVARNLEKWSGELPALYF